MTGPPRSRSWDVHGRAAPLPPLRTLRAGPLTAQLDGIDLRYVRLGSVELVRRIYVAVRDRNWVTVPARASPSRIVERDDAFEVEFDVTHLHDGLDFRWHGLITGRVDGTLAYELHGQAHADYAYNRIGICVLHPPAVLAGRRFRMHTGSGLIEGELPSLVAPVDVVDGVSRALFEPYDGLDVTLRSGGELQMRFEGDLFELIDQRNWAEGAYKSYSTPIAAGFPHHAVRGDPLEQAFRLDAVALAAGPPSDLDEGAPATLTVGEDVGETLPPIGFGLRQDGPLPTEAEIARLRALRPAHLRADVHVSADDAGVALVRAADAAEALGCPLELALHVRESEAAALGALGPRLRGVPLARILVFDPDAGTMRENETTSATLVRLAREQLAGHAPGVPIGGGTDRYLCELNRTRPEVEAFDVVSFTTNAQFHESHDLALIETLDAQRDAVLTARSFCGETPVVVSPTTLGARPGASAVGKASGALPAGVDARQLALFAAAWTLGSVKETAEAGAAALTYYETTGWRGLMETAAGSPEPALFPSLPGAVFPLYWTFAALSGLRGAELLSCSSSAPLAVAGLALRHGDAGRVVVASLLPEPQRVLVKGVAADAHAFALLSESDLPEALAAPERHRPRPLQTARSADALVLDLGAYALVVVETGEGLPPIGGG